MSSLTDDAKTPQRIPSGTVTFVFTDIEGSTQRWDRDRAAMETAVRRHDAVMRTAIAAHRGFVFKTIGDAFCAAFSRPEDAVAAMFDAQRALAAEDFGAVNGIRVRAAIHTGTADERDRDYFGPAVNRVARLVAIAYGGQVLVSGATSDLVQGSLPQEAGLRDLGEHRLKDLSRPEYVYQLLGPDLIAEFPPLRSLDRLSHNLPLQPTSFVGREREIADIAHLLETSRLVTLVGSGGVGKTRTSLQVAANSLDTFPDGAWFVELAPLSSGDLIPRATAHAMGIDLPPGGDDLEHLKAAIRGKRALVVFDNCEHLVEAAARTIAAIVRGCPQVVTLASSRQTLGIAGEAAYRLPSLDMPLAAALFAERARAADFTFELTDANAPAIADICRRLDGIALAIELAAARVKILSPKQLRDRLDERFRVLTGGSRDLLPRQQTLRALIDWSFDLLDERERTIFRRLGIFVDGFTLESAAHAAGGGDLDEFDVFDLIASLVEKSLVLAEPDGDALRYRLLESTRAYALEKLREAGEYELLADRHVRVLRDRFAEIRTRLEATMRPTEMFRTFVAELGNVRAALDASLAGPDATAGAGLLVALDLVWTRGFENEGIAALEAFRAALRSDDVRVLAILSCHQANVMSYAGRRTRARELAAESIAYARRSGETALLARALRTSADIDGHLGFLDHAAVTLAEAVGMPAVSPRETAALTHVRATFCQHSGDLDGAVPLARRYIESQRAAGNVVTALNGTVNLAEIEHGRGETVLAIALVRDHLAELERSDRMAYANASGNLTAYLAAIGDIAGALEAGRKTVAVLGAEPDHFHMTCVLEHLALVQARMGRHTEAARIAGYTAASMVSTGYTRQYTERHTWDRLIELIDDKIGPIERERLSAEGATMSPEAAVAAATAPAAKR